MSDHDGFTPLRPTGTPDLLPADAGIDPRLTRTHYFDGRLLTAADLIRDQHYLDMRLREVGQVLGSGVVRGLEVALRPDGVLTARPGQAITPAGRVIGLHTPQSVPLLDQGRLAALNDAPDGRLGSGLYVVAIQYEERGEGAAEAWPADLGDRRGLQADHWVEGARLVLVPLEHDLPQPSGRPPDDPLALLAARAWLAPEFLLRPGPPPGSGDDRVPLALLAVERGHPLWLDQDLVRRPLRRPDAEHARQRDLLAHYQELLQAVLEARRAAGLPLHFPASQHFRLLPPTGPLPQQALDPARGLQGWFPEGYTVHIAPVRQSDLAELQSQALSLAPLDLEDKRPAAVMVLVPLEDPEFEQRARQLMRPARSDPRGHGTLAHLDPLALRLSGQPDATPLDTDAAVWRDIWAVQRQPVFLRRPPLAAVSAASAVVLARGYALPEPTGDGDLQARLEQALAELADCRSELAAAEGAPRVGFLAELRKVPAELQDDVTKVATLLADQGLSVEPLLTVLLRVPRLYDTALWPSLPTVIEKAHLDDLAELALEAEPGRLGALVGAKGQALGLSTALRKRWAELDPLPPPQPAEPPSVTVRPIPELVERRPPPDAVGKRAAETLANLLRNRPGALKRVNQIVALLPKRYDPVLWPSLRRAAEKEALEKMLELLLAARRQGVPEGLQLAAWSDILGLTPAQRNRWRRLAG